MRLAVTLWLMLGIASAQVFVGGQGKIMGKGTLQPVGTVTPPPPLGLSRSFFAAGFNSSIPSPWPPVDSLGTKATITGLRIWDSGFKLSQLFTCSGTTTITCTTTSAFNSLGTLVNSTIPAYPMDVLYTFGSTPAGMAQGSTGGTCATPDVNFTCVPPVQIDANQTACNADGAASAATVHADCGNGPNSAWQQVVYKIVNQYKGSIHYWECWNEQDSNNFWTNSASFGGHSPQAANQPQMVRAVRMCSDVAHIVKALDPTAKIVSPSFHVGTALTWFHYFSTTTVNDPGCSGACSAAIGGITWAASTVTGKNTYDIVNCHCRGTSSNNADPTSFITAYNNTITEINNDGLSTLVWDDEWGPTNGNSIQSATVDFLASFIGRALTLRAQTFFNLIPIRRQWYYQWDQHQGTGNVEGLAGNIAGTAWDKVAGWLTGSSPTAACSNVGTTWTCPWKLGTTIPAEIKWNQLTLTVNTITGAGTASGGNTTYTCSSGCGGLNGEFVTISGFSNAGNNASCTVSSSGSGSFVCSNSTGAAETHSASMSYLPVTCDTACPSSSADGFTTWTDLKGVSHTVTSNQVPLGAKPVLLQ